MNAAPATCGSRVAVVLIHGIGDVSAGDVMNEAVKRIREYPEVAILEEGTFQIAPGAHASFDLPRTQLRWRGSIVDLIEFPWAGIAGKIRLRRPDRAIGQIAGVLREFPSMAVSSQSPRSFKILAAVIGYLLAALWLFWLATMGGSLIELAIKTGPWIEVDGNNIGVVPVTSLLFQGGQEFFLENSYYFSYAASWLVLLVMTVAVALAEIFLILFVISLIVPRLRRLNILLRTSAASAFVALLFCLILAFAHVGATMFIPNIVGGAELLPLALIAIAFAAILGAAFLIALFAANLLRDVVHYLGTDSAGTHLPDHQEVHKRLRQLIDALRQSPALERIVLICHSLGTVVVTDFLLAESRVHDPRRPMTVDLITAGSPIRRLINLLLPDRLPKPLEIRQRLNAGALPVARWFNAYRVADYVGMRLVGAGLDCSDPRTGIRECPLGWGRPWGHANYWADPRFVPFVATDVLTPVFVETAVK